MVKWEARFQKIFCRTYSVPVASSTPSMQTNWTHHIKQCEEIHLLLWTNLNVNLTCQPVLPYLDPQNAKFHVMCTWPITKPVVYEFVPAHTQVCMWSEPVATQWKNEYFICNSHTILRVWDNLVNHNHSNQNYKTILFIQHWFWQLPDLQHVNWQGNKMCIQIKILVKIHKNIYTIFLKKLSFL